MSDHPIRIFLIEDAPDIVDRLDTQFGVQVVVCVSSHDDVIAAAGRAGADLALIGRTVAFVNATAVCQTLKRDPRTSGLPVMMLGRREVRDEEVRAFDACADDYAAGATPLRTLAARLRALARRNTQSPQHPAIHSNGNGHTHYDDTDDGSDTVRVGSLTIRPDTYYVTVEGRAVQLTAGEFRIMWCLVVRRGTVVPHDQLAHAGHISGDGASEKSIRSHVSTLRRKLGRAGRQLKTIKGVGYCLVSSVAGDVIPTTV